MTAPNLGNLARAWRGVSAEHLRRALELQQKRPNERLGALLVEIGALKPDDLRGLVDRQLALRAGARPTYEEAVSLADFAVDELGRPPRI